MRPIRAERVGDDPAGLSPRSPGSFVLSSFRVFAILFLFAGVAAAQPPKIVDARIGFQPLSAGPRTPTHKVGLWAPVFVAVERGEGLEVHLESEDADDDAVVSKFPVSADDIARGYVKPGHVRGAMRASLRSPDGSTHSPTAIEPRTSGLRDSLYLSLGAKLDDLAAAILPRDKADEATASRFAVYETDPRKFPDRWFGYDGVDLVFVEMGDERIAERLGPLFEWVRRGGRAVVAVDPERGWLGKGSRPPIAAKNLNAVEAWTGLHDKPFPPRGEPSVPIAHLDLSAIAPGPWDVYARLDDPRTADRPPPLIARTSYGFGSLTVVAFPLASGPFAKWSGRVDFLRAMVDQFGPKYASPDRSASDRRRRESDVVDWGAQLERELENFDVPALSFGAVALLMALYAIVVSAGDYFLLRRWLGRPEATWISLPILVVGACVLAFAGLGLRDDPGLMANEVVLLDLADGRGAAHASVFFALRADANRSATLSGSALGAFGRPDDGPAGMGRAGGLPLAPRPYFVRFDPGSDGVELADVPFLFRGVDAFALDRMADDIPATVESHLAYHPRDHRLKVSGTIATSFDLDEAALFVFDRVYPIAGGLKKGTTVVEILESDVGLLPVEWRDKTDADRPATPHGRYDPGLALRNIMFHERLDPNLRAGNHLFRRLDWSWRLRDDPRVVNVPLSSLGDREAILVGRTKGGAPAFWRMFDGRDIRPDRETRDVYVRAILPLRASELAAQRGIP